MSNPLDFLFGSKSTEAPAAVTETEAPPVVETVAEPMEPVAEPAATEETPPAGPWSSTPRGPDGKFTTAVPATPRESVEPGHVPIASLLDERDKRQAAETARRDLEAQLQALRGQQPPPEPLEPTEALQQALYQQNLRASRRFAEKEYGKEMIATVHSWAEQRCGSDPVFNDQMRSSDDPYEAAVQAWNREQIVSTVKPEHLDEFRAWLATKQQAQASTVQQAQTPPSSQTTPAAAIPRSLATATGNGATGAPHVPIGGGNAYQALFNR